MPKILEKLCWNIGFWLTDFGFWIHDRAKPFFSYAAALRTRMEKLDAKD